MYNDTSKDEYWKIFKKNFFNILLIKSRDYLIFILSKINFLKKEDQNQKFFLYNFSFWKRDENWWMKIKKIYSRCSLEFIIRFTWVQISVSNFVHFQKVKLKSKNILEKISGASWSMIKKVSHKNFDKMCIFKNFLLKKIYRASQTSSKIPDFVGCPFKKIRHSPQKSHTIFFVKTVY